MPHRLSPALVTCCLLLAPTIIQGGTLRGAEGEGFPSAVGQWLEYHHAQEIMYVKHYGGAGKHNPPHPQEEDPTATPPPPPSPTNSTTNITTTALLVDDDDDGVVHRRRLHEDIRYQKQREEYIKKRDYGHIHPDVVFGQQNVTEAEEEENLFREKLRSPTASEGKEGHVERLGGAKGLPSVPKSIMAWLNYHHINTKATPEATSHHY